MMKLDKRIALVLLIAVLPTFAQAKLLTIGLINYPPHMDLKTDVRKSKLYKYINTAFTDQGFEVIFNQYPNKRGKIELRKGKIDLLLPFDDEASDGIRLLTKPLFHSIPGLCFKKSKFIPILSATHLFKDLKVGTPAGIDVVSVLKDSGANLMLLQGSDATNRGIDLTQRGRIDAFYHPSPLKMYHQNNRRFKEVVCSYFHGFPNPVHIAATKALEPGEFKILDETFTKAIDALSYEYFFAK